MKRLPALFLLTFLPALPVAAGTAESVAALLAVGPEGKGNAEASAAWEKLAAETPVAGVTDLLAAMDKANPLARNWLRGAVSAVLDRGRNAGQPVPAAELAAFARDRSHGAAGRQMAFDLLQEADATLWATLVPDFLEDPVPALRREPVRLLTEKGMAAKDSALLRKALDAARDQDQVDTIATALREAGETVDLPRHFGFLMDWKVAGPFDNKGRAGFDAVFPPEEAVDFAAVLTGRPEADGAPVQVRWTDYQSKDDYGMINFNQPLGMLKEVTGYAATVFHSPDERDAELRLGCKNAWKVWCNGQLLFGRDEYHRGARIDQYILPIRLKKGENLILVKCCQNEQTETWTVQWEFQLRVCDETGTALLDPTR